MASKKSRVWSTAWRMLLRPIIKLAVRVAVWLTVLLAPVAVVVWAVIESTSAAPRHVDLVWKVAGVLTVAAALWSEMRVRSDLSAGGVAPVVSGVAGDAATVLGFGMPIQSALRRNWDLFDRLSAGLTVLAAFTFAGFAPQAMPATRVWPAVTAAGVLAGLTWVRRQGARHRRRLGWREVRNLLTFGLPAGVIGAGVLGTAVTALGQWRGVMHLEQVAVAAIVGALAAASMFALPAQSKTRSRVVEPLAAALRVPAPALSDPADGLRWDIEYSRGLFRKKVPTAITLYRPPASALNALADLPARVAELLPEWHVADAGPGRIRLEPASPEVLRAREAVAASEGLFAFDVPQLVNPNLIVPTSSIRLEV